jgi:ribosomal protein S18 acetylase RimI-like enzyme
MNPLDNPIWGALSSEQSHFARTNGPAKCFPGDISPLAGVEVPTLAAFTALSELVGPSRHFVLFTKGSPMLPEGWETGIDGDIAQMVLAEPLPPLTPLKDGAKVVPLGEADVEDMLALVELTRPGPFEERTRLMGNYMGIWQDGQLVAMAGERLHVSGYREISAVCTHPDFQGRGYARQVMATVANQMLARGETPMLHVYEGNTGAIRVYEALGFRFRTMLHFTWVLPRRVFASACEISCSFSS